MRIKFFVMAVASCGALALVAPMAKAMPLAKPALDVSIHKAHAVRVCERNGECWRTYIHPHSRYWNEESGGKRLDFYGRAPHRNVDRDNDRNRDVNRNRDEKVAR